MHLFARLRAELDASAAPHHQQAALRAHLAAAEPADAAWALYLLAGGRTRRSLAPAALLRIARQASGLPGWLFDACHATVGEVAQTVALVWPDPPPAAAEGEGDRTEARAAPGLAVWMDERLPRLREQTEPEQQATLCRWWNELDLDGRLLLNRLVAGGLRPGVSPGLLQQAVAAHAGLDPTLVAQRLARHLQGPGRRPAAADLIALLAPPPAACAPTGQPYAFEAFPVLTPADTEAPDTRLGAPADWRADGTHDGLPVQVVRRAGQVWIWSPAQALVTTHHPDVAGQAMQLPDGTVLSGELLVWRPGAPAPESALLLLPRTRRPPGRRLLEQAPAMVLVHDLLELDGLDRRAQPLQQRLAALERLALPATWRRSAPIRFEHWAALQQQHPDLRRHGMTGLLLRRGHPSAGDGPGRTWPADPMRATAVLVHAQADASGLTDCSFAVWSHRPTSSEQVRVVLEQIERREPAAPGALQLVTVAKVTEGLDEVRRREIQRVVKATTLERFGPVRSVRPGLVAELGFESIGPSARHRSGLAVAGARLLRLCGERSLLDLDTLDDLRALAGRGSE